MTTKKSHFDNYCSQVGITSKAYTNNATVSLTF